MALLLKVCVLLHVALLMRAQVEEEVKKERPQNDDDIQKMLSRMLYKYDRRVRGILFLHFQ